MSGATPWLGDSAEQERSATLCVPTVNLFQHLALLKIQSLFSPQGTESNYGFYISCSSLHYGPRLPSVVKVFGLKGAYFENSWDHWSVGTIYQHLSFHLPSSFFPLLLLIFNSCLSLLEYYFCPDTMKKASKYDSYVSLRLSNHEANKKNLKRIC